MDHKERTALSTLRGLRIKFAKEIKSTRKYTPLELNILIAELLRKIDNGQTVNLVDRENEPDEVWDVVDEQIERSKIKRFPWKKILGKSLTQEILLKKKQDLTVKETFEALANDERITNFILEYPKQEKDLIKNLEISVHARYGENNTAEKVMREGNRRQKQNEL